MLAENFAVLTLCHHYSSFILICIPFLSISFHGFTPVLCLTSVFTFKIDFLSLVVTEKHVSMLKMQLGFQGGVVSTLVKSRGKVCGRFQCFGIQICSNSQFMALAHQLQCCIQMYFGTIWLVWAPKKIAPKKVLVILFPFIFHLKTKWNIGYKYLKTKIFSRDKYPSPNALNKNHFQRLIYKHWEFLGITKRSNP